MLTSILHKLHSHYHPHYHSSNILQISFNILPTFFQYPSTSFILITILPSSFKYPSTSFQHSSNILQHPSNIFQPSFIHPTPSAHFTPSFLPSPMSKKVFFNDEVLLKDILSLTLTLGWKNKKRPSGPIELDLEASNLVFLSKSFILSFTLM